MMLTFGQKDRSNVEYFQARPFVESAAKVLKEPKPLQTEELYAVQLVILTGPKDG
jgi:hypothetical protein